MQLRFLMLLNGGEHKDKSNCIHHVLAKLNIGSHKLRLYMSITDLVTAHKNLETTL